jgi:hypothetical protein
LPLLALLSLPLLALLELPVLAPLSLPVLTPLSLPLLTLSSLPLLTLLSLPLPVLLPLPLLVLLPLPLLVLLLLPLLVLLLSFRSEAEESAVASHTLESDRPKGGAFRHHWLEPSKSALIPLRTGHRKPVKPPNHVSRALTTTYRWRIRYGETVILSTKHKKPRPKAGFLHV